MELEFGIECWKPIPHNGADMSGSLPFLSKAMF